jgi:tetratricopeptide (TPR) repeat protein
MLASSSGTPQQGAAGKRPLRARILMILALSVLILAVYFPVGGHEFIFYDDPQYVIENPMLTGGLSGRTLLWALTTTKAANWHPLTWLSHLVDVSFFGLAAGGHHITNLVLHLLNAAILFLLLAEMTGSPRRSWVVAALFAVHPLHVESVAWVAERKDLLSGLFWFLTTGAYLHYARRPGAARYVLVVLSFALGLMAKPMLVTLPLVLLVLDYWPLGRLSFMAQRTNPGHSNTTRLLTEKLPLLALSAASAIITFAVQAGAGAVASLEDLPAAARVANALGAFALYLGKTVWPQALAVFYPHSISQASPWLTATALFVMAALTTIAVKKQRLQPWLATGWLWFVISLGPVVGLVQVGAQSMADRYTYLPLTGLFIAVVWFFSAAARKNSRLTGAMVAVAVVALGADGLMARIQVGYWHDDRSLFQHALRVTENNWLAYEHVGNGLAEEGQDEAAIGCFIEALRIKPDQHAEITPRLILSSVRLGEALVQRGDLAAAEAVYRRMLEHSESDKAGPHLSEYFAKVFNTLGVIVARRGAKEEAVTLFSKSVEMKADFAEARFNLAFALEKVGRLTQAIDQYREVLELSPQDAQARQYLDRALALAASNHSVR